jgi:hypothetical protein
VQGARREGWWHAWLATTAALCPSSAAARDDLGPIWASGHGHFTGFRDPWVAIWRSPASPGSSSSHHFVLSSATPASDVGAAGAAFE